MTEKYGFVYIWRDKKRNRYYIGCHWGTVDDGYICSSNWMQTTYKRRPADFRRRILTTNLTREEMYIEEHRFFNMIQTDQLRERYYNLRLDTNTRPWHMDPDKSLSVGEKISKAKKGKKVTPCSPERAKAISEAKKGKALTAEHREALSKAKTGSTLSETQKDSISATLTEYYQNNEHKNKGKPLTEEHRKAISEGMVGKKRNGYTQSDLTRAAMAKSASAAHKANLGARAYNNGTKEKRCKEHPGEGWALGGLPRAQKS